MLQIVLTAGLTNWVMGHEIGINDFNSRNCSFTSASVSGVTLGISFFIVHKVTPAY